MGRNNLNDEGEGMGGNALTAGGSSGLVPDDVDLVDEGELLEQGEELSLVHVLWHLANEELHAVLALLILRLRH